MTTATVIPMPTREAIMAATGVDDAGGKTVSISDKINAGMDGVPELVANYTKAIQATDTAQLPTRDKCRNCARPNYYGDKYGGYCFDCNDAGIPDLLAEIESLRAEVARLKEAARLTNVETIQPHNPCCAILTGVNLNPGAEGEHD